MITGGSAILSSTTQTEANAHIDSSPGEEQSSQALARSAGKHVRECGSVLHYIYPVTPRLALQSIWCKHQMTPQAVILFIFARSVPSQHVKRCVEPGPLHLYSKPACMGVNLLCAQCVVQHPVLNVKYAFSETYYLGRTYPCH